MRVSTGRAFGVALLLALVLAVAPKAATAGEKPKDIFLAQVAWGLDDIFFQTVQDGLKYKMDQLAEAGGYKFERNLRGSNDPGQQVTMLQALLALNPNFMVFCPNDSKLLGPVRQYNDRNIPVITNNVTIYGGTHTFVAFDNVISGETCAKALIRLLSEKYGPEPKDWVAKGGVNGKAVIVQMMGELAMSIAQERRKGFEDIMKPIADATPGLEIVSEEVKFNADIAYRALTNIQTVHGDAIIGIYCADDTSAVGGIWPSLVAAGRGFPSDDPRHIPIVCIDGTEAALRAVREKKIDAIAVQPAWGEGELVAMLIDAINRNGAAAIAKVGDKLYTAENRPMIMDLIPDQFTAEEHAKGGKPVWAPVEVVEGKTAYGQWDGVWYKTNSTSTVPWDYPADSKLLWGNFWSYLKNGTWPWDR